MLSRSIYASLSFTVDLYVPLSLTSLSPSPHSMCMCIYRQTYGTHYLYRFYSIVHVKFEVTCLAQDVNRTLNVVQVFKRPLQSPGKFVQLSEKSFHFLHVIDLQRLTELIHP